MARIFYVKELVDSPRGPVPSYYKVTEVVTADVDDTAKTIISARSKIRIDPVIENQMLGTQIANLTQAIADLQAQQAQLNSIISASVDGKL